MDKYYAVFDSNTQGFVPLGTGSTLSKDLEFVKSVATAQNAAHVPAMQTYTVATVVFDPEV